MAYEIGEGPSALAALDSINLNARALSEVSRLELFELYEFRVLIPVVCTPSFQHQLQSRSLLSSDWISMHQLGVTIFDCAEKKRLGVGIVRAEWLGRC